ncbi:MAG: SCO1664 family protein [Pseudoclavibacter sp.]
MTTPEPAAAVNDPLRVGAAELVGQFADSSNETFLVELADGDDSTLAVYKPELGERPLRDFEPGLYRRERAAYLLSEHLGWGVVPRTIVREDLPFGVGSLQQFIETDPAEHYFTMFADAPETHGDLRRLAVFDFIANNTDRKSGHVLRGLDGRVWGIDHGLCFAAEFKLRTVIWDFAGEVIAHDLVDDVSGLLDEVPEGVRELLDDDELRALRGRARYVLATSRLPVDPTGMRYPWPLV